MSANWVKEHLISRGVNPDLYSVFCDDEEGVATFLLYNLSGEVVGYQQYRPGADKLCKNARDGRYFTHAKGNAVFGLECLNENDRNLFVVEGIFKAAVLHRLGYNAIAVLTSTPTPLESWFYVMSKTWNLVAIGDNDKAGAKLVGIVGKGIQSPVDLDEMTDYNVGKLVEHFAG